MDKKALPEWWTMFVEAIRTKTLDQYVCCHVKWPCTEPWSDAAWQVANIHAAPENWHFRANPRTTNVGGVDLEAPILAKDVVPRDREVWSLSSMEPDRADDHLDCALVFTSKAACDAMRAALLWSEE